MPPAETLEDNEPLKKALESLLFITDHPLGPEDLAKITGVKDRERILALVGEIRRELEEKGSAVQLLEVAEGFQMATRPAYGPYVRKLFAERMTMRLSTAALETLSIVAYKQPITRAEIEEVRGVEVIAALETLLEKRLLKVVGRKESVGRPLMYGTTADFLRHFGLKGLEELPSLESFTPPEPAAPAANAILEGGGDGALRGTAPGVNAVPKDARDGLPNPAEAAKAPEAEPAAEEAGARAEPQTSETP